MASTLSMATTGVSYGNFRPNRTHVSVGGGRRRVVVRAEGINPEIRKTEEKVVDSVLVTDITKPVTAYCSVGGRRYVAVRAEGINPEIRKTEEKLADSVLVTDITKPVTAYCRCWRSKTFPLCDGSHVKHNKSTGDNVGPLLLKTK